MIFVKTRWIAKIWNKFLIWKEINKNGNEQFTIPWWTLEWGETLEECFKREMFEETWIKVKKWELLWIYEWIYKDRNTTWINFFYKIENPEDYTKIDLSKATHGYESTWIWYLTLDEIIKADLPIYPFMEDKETINNFFK